MLMQMASMVGCLSANNTASSVSIQHTMQAVLTILKLTFCYSLLAWDSPVFWLLMSSRLVASFFHLHISLSDIFQNITSHVMQSCINAVQPEPSLDGLLHMFIEQLLAPVGTGTMHLAVLCHHGLCFA